MEGSLVSNPSVRFEVQKVLGISSDGTYQVQWAPAWVSKFHLVGCEHLIQEFLRDQTEKEKEDEIPLDTSNTIAQLKPVGSTIDDGVVKILPDVKDDFHPNLGVDFASDRSESSSVDNFLSDAIISGIKIEEEEEMDDFNADLSLIIQKDIQPLRPIQNSLDAMKSVGFTELHHNHNSMRTEDENIGNNSFVPYSKSPTFMDVHKNAFNNYRNLVTMAQYKSSPTLRYTHGALTPRDALTSSKQVATLAVTSCKAATLPVTCKDVSGSFPLAPKMFNEMNSCSGEQQIQNESTVAPRITTEALPEGDVVKKHVCTVCQKQFSHKGHLRDHLRVHTGVKPYTCDYCSKSFAQVGNLHQHVRIHSGEKFLCHLCGKSFSRRNTLDKHVQTHANAKEYQCHVCQKKFWLEDAFEKHLRTHSSEGGT